MTLNMERHHLSYVLTPLMLKDTHVRKLLRQLFKETWTLLQHTPLKIQHTPLKIQCPLCGVQSVVIPSLISWCICILSLWI